MPFIPQPLGFDMRSPKDPSSASPPGLPGSTGSPRPGDCVDRPEEAGPAIRGPIDEALKLLPDGVFLITAAYDTERSGIRVMSVMRCADIPVLLAVAARKGHAIEPLIRDSHHFALCVVRPDDRLLKRKFPPGAEPVGGGDPFDAMPTENLGSGAPVPARCAAAFDCEVVRHFDLDADHEIYVGQVLAVKIFE